LKAVCASEPQAAEIRRLLQGLNDFLGGILRGVQGSRGPTEWQRVLATAAIDQKGAVVHAAWTLDGSLLESLAKAGEESSKERGSP
jgi:hypothetical protein